MKKIVWALSLWAAFSAVGVVGAQGPISKDATAEKVVAISISKEKKVPAFEDKRIEINLASRLLTLYHGDTGIRMYPVAPGKPSSPTPIGRRKVVSLEKNPTWIDPENPTVEVPSGPDCPLGYRWIGLGGNYGIHGTNSPRSIGNYASHGCVRMYEKDVEDLFDHIVKGIPVDIKYERVVVEKDPDHTVLYYIYPDGYQIQPLTVSDVRNKISSFGVAGLEEDSAIESAIKASDGQPHYIAKVYDLYVNGVKQDFSAYGKDGHIYLPAMALAKAAGVYAEWSPNWKQLKTTYGTAAGIQRGKSLYIDANDAPSLLHLKGQLDEKGNYVMEGLSV